MQHIRVLSFRPQEDSRLGPAVGWIVKILVVYSTVMFMFEVDWAENSLLGNHRWLWSERVVAGLFTLEYLLRLKTAPKPLKYATSGFGIIDLLAILPFWIGFFVPTNPTIYLRLVRTFRILRLLKLIRYMPRVQLLMRALISCWNELLAVGYLCFVVFLFGSVAIWEIERHAQPDKYAKLGDAMWWMIVTLTTVGYGDVSPITPLGKGVAVIIMIFGLGIVAGYVGLVANTVYHVFNPVHEFDDELRDIPSALARSSRSQDRPPD